MKPMNLLAFLMIALAPAAFAQAPPAETPKPSSPQAEAGEPRANTSPQAEAGEPRAQTSPTAATPQPKPAAAGTPPTKGTAAKAGNDRVQLSTATVTGDREQPKVMYVVPWKRSDMGDLEGKPMNSLVDEILSPVDRDVFRREVRYYQTVNADAQANKPVPGQGEK